MIEPVHVDVQKIAASAIVPSRHLDAERRRFAHLQIEYAIARLVGKDVMVRGYDETQSPTYLPPDLAWWERILQMLGKHYPDRVVMFTRIVGFAYGCRHPFTGEWIEAEPSTRYLSFLPPTRPPATP